MLKEIVKKHTLKNIHDYGKADVGSILGKVIAEFPAAKKEVKRVIEEIKNEIEYWKGRKKEEIEEALKEYSFEDRKKEEKTLEVPHAFKGLRTRFPPEPSGYLHIGHAKAVFLNHEIAKKYEGEMILRFDDTNPLKAKAHFVDAIKEDLRWLGIKWEKESFTSEHLEEIYDAAKKLIDKEEAYICTCPPERIKESRSRGEGCACREKKREWEMLEQAKEGEAILRLKGDMGAPNTVMRDPTLARVIEKEHFRTGKRYRIWPSYDLAVCVMDHLENITHVMRSKEYELRDELYRTLCKKLGWKEPVLITFSRLNIKNAPVSKRLITPLVEKRQVWGWDDPRLPTLAGLRRRGIMPHAIKEFVLSFGISKVDSEPDWEVLLAFNRKILDKKAKHYFFVPDPILISVEGLEKGVRELPLHPKGEVKGTRMLEYNKEIYISREDWEELQNGNVFRLKDLCNAEVVDKEKKLCRIEKKSNPKKLKKIQWVGEGIECSVYIPKELLIDGRYNEDSLKEVNGLLEKSGKEIKKGEVVQFERFGFCRKDSEKTFIYSC